MRMRKITLALNETVNLSV